jgi:hypothetical protein
MDINQLLDQQIEKMNKEQAQILANANFVNGAKSMAEFLKAELNKPEETVK